MDHCILYLCLFQKLYTTKSQKKKLYIYSWLVQIYQTLHSSNIYDNCECCFSVSGVSDTRDIYAGDFVCFSKWRT